MSASNGVNEFGVTFGRIMFLQKILETHRNVLILDRHDDIVFEIQRYKQNDRLFVVCIDEYTCSLESVMRVMQKFPKTNVIFVGGKWNSYTKEAFDFCQSIKIGIYNAGDISGGLREDAFWSYEKLDDEGNSTRSVKA
jgi:hypothetical protein